MSVVLQGAAHPVQGVHALLGFQGFVVPDDLQGFCFLGAQVVQRRLHQGALILQTFSGQANRFLGEVLLNALALLEEVLTHLQLCTISLNSRAAALDAHNVSAVAAQLLVVVLREHLDLLSNRQVLLQRLVVLRSKFELLGLSLKLQCGQLRRSLLRGPGRLGVSTEHLDLLLQVLTLKFRSHRGLVHHVVVILIYADPALVVHGFHVRTLSVRHQLECLIVFVVPLSCYAWAASASAVASTLEVRQAPCLKSSNTLLKHVFKLLCLVFSFLKSNVVTFLGAFPAFCRRTIKPVFRCSS